MSAPDLAELGAKASLSGSKEPGKMMVPSTLPTAATVR